MVQLAATLDVINDTACVVLEDGLVGFDGYGDRLDGESEEQGGLVERWDATVRVDAGYAAALVVALRVCPGSQSIKRPTSGNECVQQCGYVRCWVLEWVSG